MRCWTASALISDMAADGRLRFGASVVAVMGESIGVVESVDVDDDGDANDYDDRLGKRAGK